MWLRRLRLAQTMRYPHLGRRELDKRRTKERRRLGKRQSRYLRRSDYANFSINNWRDS
jgi:hypothetical protein